MNSPIKPLTSAELARIRERANAASHGPWEGKKGITQAWVVDTGGKAILESYDTRLLDNHDQTVADIDFTAHSRGDIPQLLATVDHYRKREDRLSDLIKELRDPKGNGRIGASYAANRIDEILNGPERETGE